MALPDVYAEAVSLMEENRHANATGALEKAIGENIGDALLHALLAECYRVSGRLEDCVRELNLARQFGSDDADVRVQCALTNLNSGRLSEARRDLEDAAEMAPENPHVYAAFAELELKTGDNAAFRRHIERAIAIDPEYEYTLSVITQHGLDVGNLNEARDSAARVLAQDPDNPRSLCAMAVVEFFDAHYERAAELALSVIRRNPSDRVATWIFFAADSARRSTVAGILWRPIIWCFGRGWKGSTIFYASWLTMCLVLLPIAKVTGHLWMAIALGLGFLVLFRLVILSTALMADRAGRRALDTVELREDF